MRPAGGEGPDDHLRFRTFSDVFFLMTQPEMPNFASVPMMMMKMNDDDDH